MPREHIIPYPFPLDTQPGEREVPQPEIASRTVKQGRKNPGERMLPPGCDYVRQLRESLQRPEDGPRNSL